LEFDFRGPSASSIGPLFSGGYTLAFCFNVLSLPGTPGHGEKPPRKKDDLGGNNCQIMVPPD